jgi:Peptidase family M1 domain
MKARLFIFIVSSVLFLSATAQPGRWQQRVKYNMEVDVDATTNTFKGRQKLAYTNNAPDTLKKVFYHLYWNAFQPSSMMDERSRHLGAISIRKDRNGNNVPEWDGRVKDRIQKLQPNETGYQKILSLLVNGVAQKYKVHETILEVELTKPILPNSTVVFDMNFETQVPIQIRRSGRDNAEGIRYSMAQWYPKMCEYDYEGWHPTPYVAREFYGVWGDYDVKITIDKKYMIASTGYLQNPQQIGFGYEAPGSKIVSGIGDKLTWHFVAPNVHDFVWAADPNYVHLSKKVKGDRVLHVFYKPSTPAQDSAWMHVLYAAEKVLPYIESRFGAYPYKQYSFIEGGDGGMEYPMATLLKGPGLGTVFHEWMHTWYQMLMATNESLYGWMDEGFTSYAEGEVNAYYINNFAAASPFYTNKTWVAKQQKEISEELPLYHQGAYDNYSFLAKSGYEEPLTTHADHFETKLGYEVASYSKGEVFLTQLGYIVGDKVRDKILLNYYNAWHFKHPAANDFIRIAEKTSGLQLDWYKEYWVNTTKTIDYSIDSVWEQEGKTNIRIKRVGAIPMPVDVLLTLKNGNRQMHYIPAYLMFGNKQPDDNNSKWFIYEPWKWTHETYVIKTDTKMNDIAFVEIDATKRMADVNPKDNFAEVK